MRNFFSNFSFFSRKSDPMTVGQGSGHVRKHENTGMLMSNRATMLFARFAFAGTIFMAMVLFTMGSDNPLNPCGKVSAASTICNVASNHVFDSGITVNDDSGAAATDDFRVESDNEANLIDTDASGDFVAFGQDASLNSLGFEVIFPAGMQSVAITSTLSVVGLATLASVDINGGNIDGTVIGASSAVAGSFTTLTGSTIDGPIGSVVATTGVFTTLTATTIDGLIGSITPADATFTALTATTIDGLIGSITPAAATVTTFVATSGSFSDGNITNVGNIALDSLSADGSNIAINDNVFWANNTGIVVGHTAQITAGGNDPEFQVLGAGTPDSRILLGRFSGDTTPPAFIFVKSRGVSITDGTAGIVLDNDQLLEIRAIGDDGNDLASLAGQIRIEVDGTPGTDDMPGRIILATTQDGASSVTEAMRIDSTQSIGIGTSSVDIIGDLHVYDTTTDVYIESDSHSVLHFEDQGGSPQEFSIGIDAGEAGNADFHIYDETDSAAVLSIRSGSQDIDLLNNDLNNIGNANTDITSTLAQFGVDLITDGNLTINNASTDGDGLLEKSGSGSYDTFTVSIFKDGITDNTTTAVFTITTPDQGNAGDSLSVTVKGVIVAGTGVAGSNNASKIIDFRFGTSNWFGTTTVSAVTEVYESASITGNGGQKGVGTVTMTVSATDTVITVSFLVDVNGTEPDQADLGLDIEIHHYGPGALPIVATS